MKHSQRLLITSLLQKFSDAALDLSGAWMDDDTDKVGEALTPDFPFDKSFDDMALRIRDWKDKATDRLLAYVPQDTVKVEYKEYGYILVDIGTFNVVFVHNPLQRHLAERDRANLRAIKSVDLAEYCKFFHTDIDQLEGQTIDLRLVSFTFFDGERYIHNDEYRKEIAGGWDRDKAQHDPDLAEIGNIAAVVCRNLDLSQPEYGGGHWGALEVCAEVGKFAVQFEAKYRGVTEWAVYCDAYTQASDWEDLVVNEASEYLKIWAQARKNGQAEPKLKDRNGNLTFEAFLKSKLYYSVKQVQINPDLAHIKDMEDGNFDSRLGYFVYDKGSFIAHLTDGSFWMPISNHDYRDRDLEFMEKKLYTEHYLSA